MRDSLRARLLLWHISILALTIAVFGVVVCYLFWRSLLIDLDRTLRAEAEVIAEALHPTASGTFDLELPQEFTRDFQPDSANRRYYAIWNAEGGLVDRSDPDMTLSAVETPLERNRDGMREVAVRTAGGAIVVVGQHLTDLSAALWSLAGLIAGVGMAALGLAMAGGFALAGRALAPIARISEAATAMAGGDFSARIATERTETELGQVAKALNSAFDRLHLALEQQRRFTADASHELRTPLSVLAAEVEWASARTRSIEEYQGSLETCQRAAARMREVVEGLLTLARADAGQLALRLEPVSLQNIVQDVTSLMRPFAAKHHVDLRTSSANEDVVVSGDSDRLREVLTNLLSNAIQYNRPGGFVDLRIWREGAVACLQVEDTGIGIAPADIPRVFERFFRADPARAREVGGAGIGLAVTKWIVDAHGGEIGCSSEPGRGTRFVVRLPVESGGTAGEH